MTLSFIFVFGHTSTHHPTLCEYLKLDDCAEYCKQAELPMLNNVHTIVSTLIDLQQARYFITGRI
jgi:hypothetical protein